MEKSNVIFIGAFKNTTGDGGTGGQLFACTSLIESDLKNQFDFYLIDTTAVSIPAPPVYKRLYHVFHRQFLLLKYLLFYRVETVIAFSSSGLSFVEKGMMLLVSNIFGKRTIFAPRSGITKLDYDSSKIYRFIIPYIVNRVDLLICQNQKWKSFYEGITSPNQKKFKVVRNWIDLDKYEENVSRLKNFNPPHILYLGWLETYKGINDLVLAVQILKNRKVPFILNIFGSGSQLQKVESSIEHFGLRDCVKLMGWANFNQKMEAFNWADIYVVPSHMEGSPNSILEAMALGVPILGTRIDGIEELLKNESGLIVEKENPESLADGMVKLIKDISLRESLRKNALVKVKHQHGIEAAVNNWSSILSE